jgi:hypothetical protein
MTIRDLFLSAPGQHLDELYGLLSTGVKQSHVLRLPLLNEVPNEKERSSGKWLAKKHSAHKNQIAVTWAKSKNMATIWEITLKAPMKILFKD